MAHYRELVLPKRPGCLTILAILYILGAAIYLLNGAIVATGIIESPYALPAFRPLKLAC